VKVVQVATAQDVGVALNPLSVLGQIEGGIAQGLGLAVMEEIVQIDGRIRNASFTDYLLPTFLDMPPVVASLVEESAAEMAASTASPSSTLNTPRPSSGMSTLPCSATVDSREILIAAAFHIDCATGNHGTRPKACERVVSP
jgi:xanthine dehydrogenase molybdopterin-binding subunit B